MDDTDQVNGHQSDSNVIVSSEEGGGCQFGEKKNRK